MQAITISLDTGHRPQIGHRKTGSYFQAWELTIVKGYNSRHKSIALILITVDDVENNA